MPAHWSENPDNASQIWDSNSSQWIRKPDNYAQMMGTVGTTGAGGTNNGYGATDGSEAGNARAEAQAGVIRDVGQVGQPGSKLSAGMVNQEIQNTDSTYGRQQPPTGGPDPGYQAAAKAANATASPEANAAIQGGTNLNQQASAAPTPQGQAPVQDGGSATPATTAPTGPVSAPAAGSGGAPLSLYGHSTTDQAKMLSDYLQSQGVNVGAFTVGGTSPYDGQINSVIDQINNPTTTEAARKAAAQQLGQLIQLRTNSAKGADGDVFQYDSKTGQYGAVGNNQNATSLIAGLSGTPSSGTSSPSSGSGAVGDKISSYLNEMQGALDKQGGINKAQFLADSGNSELATRQALARRLASLGIEGGAANDAISQEQMGALSARDQGLSSLQSNMLSAQENAKTQALSAFLSGQGLDSTRAIQQAQLALEHENQQTNAALGQRGQDVNLNVANAQMNMGLLNHLLDLAWAGDQNAQAQVNQMIQQLITGGA